MSREELVALGVRLFAIALFVYTLQFVPAVTFYWNDEMEPAAMWYFVAMMALVLLIVGVLWRFPRVVARHLLPMRVLEDTAFRWTQQDLMQVGFVLLGVLLLYLALSDAMYWLSLFVLSRGSEITNGVQIEIRPDQQAAMVTTVFEVVIAVALILGSSGLSRLLNYIRFGRV